MEAKTREQLIDAGTHWVASLPVVPAMAAAYGSALGASFDPSRSDLNLLLLSPLEAIATLAEPIQTARMHRLSVLVLTPAEFQRLPWLFPIKLHALRRHYRILAGKDWLATCMPDPDALARECRVDLQNVALKLRRALVQGAPDPRPLQEAMRRFLPQLRDVLRVLHERAAGAPDASMDAVLAHLSEHFGFEVDAWQRSDALRGTQAPTWPDALDAVQALATALEHLQERLPT